MKQVPVIYAVPNYECTLDCPHCSIHKKKIEYDREKFVNAVNKQENSIVILFGGEPTLHEDRFLDICNSCKVSTVSTNLLYLSEKVWDRILTSSYSIATSWNMTRFSPEQYTLWLSNLERLGNAERRAMVLITMTPDLIADNQLEKVSQVLSDIENTHGVDRILFEHLIDDSTTDEFHSKCDDWLCKMHEIWNFSMKNDIEERVFHWEFDCSNVQTVQPNGTVDIGCPQRKTVINNSCLSCPRASECRPCALQNSCTFPKKLYNMLSANK